MPSTTRTRARVSVIIPAYNAAKTLQSCLDALMLQTRIPDEIIVVDDGSVDETKGVAESYSLVTVISQKNQGPARARNVGASRAKGTIIVFLDSDCVPEKNWLDEMIKPFTDEKVIGVQGAYRTKQTSLVARFDQLDIEYRYERMKRATTLDWIGSYSAAYRKKIFIEEGGFDESFPKASGEDAELSYRMAKKGHRLIFAPQAVVFHTHPQDLFHYLKVKYFRAYWRMRMYIKHPRKLIRDSYTPTSLKLSVTLAISSVLFALGSLLLPVWEYWSLLCFIGFLFLYSLSYSPMRAGILLWTFGLVIYFFRSLAFAAGMSAGFLDRRVWS
ncbi:MAG: glycosyltransferase [Candidatus Diapherotrites archaeon]|uniref:Glycosyltransferase n=1 Tax=Candidatus Iainarchaeum sp. TaxID=3101447 RepID=A0A8T4C635_9ARCH|nr:glycosyltransferase [Candidatus Diapherotrites archaeon]